MTRPQRSNKYKVYRRSKYEFPTRFPGQRGEQLHVGSEAALKSIQGQLGRSLKDGTITAHTDSQWVWKEPK